jgi:prenyltransferase beta subunit
MIFIVMIWIMSSPAISGVSDVTNDDITLNKPLMASSSTGIQTSLGSYVIIELTGASIAPRGSSLSSLLTESYVPHAKYSVSEVLANCSLLDGAQALILDASCGSGDGAAVSGEFITLLVRLDLPTILVGRAAWLLHRLRQTSPPESTAILSAHLQTTSEYEGAVFLSQPISLTIGSLLTVESGLYLPVDEVQAERSRLIDLTGTTTPAALSPLRYDSWPLDVFLFGPEDPVQWTGDGKGLLVNTLAYCAALRETSLASFLQATQSKPGQTLAGGLHYSHTPSISSTYLAVHTVRDLMDTGSFTGWRSDNQLLVQSVLQNLYVDTGSEAGFTNSVYDGVVSEDSTAMGLWLTSVMGLDSEFSVAKLTKYLSSRQDSDGGFSNHMTITFHVTESLYESGGLNQINRVSLESWLRSCVVDGSTGAPENWGGAAKNPTSGEARNIYSSQYVQSLWMLGKAHTDPLKMTEWVQDTSNGDGSFRDIVSADMYITRGTSSALTTMSILGTLTASNKSAGLNWFTANQLPSGGFGMGESSQDIVAKTSAAAEVATCLKKLGETTSPLSDGVLTYIDGVQSDAGFEVMEAIPSLMWSYWLAEASRSAHTGNVDSHSLEDYLSGFTGTALTQYPGQSNLTVQGAPEYDNQQYYLTGVWAQYFGTSLASDEEIGLSPSQVSYITLYLSLRQDTGGQYRPSVMGTPHMQYTAAAVEALYQLDELDTIRYRSALESSMLSLYSSGSWNVAGWDLAPFAGVQPAIDFLSTRAALRLGLVTSSMANEIASTIDSRLQYSDLWALSWDVKTLALLNSTFAVSLEAVDCSSVLGSLGTHFTEGWFNSSAIWQPVYTAGVLDIVSILGLRPQMVMVGGCTLTASVPVTAQLGETLSIAVSITSTETTHSVYVRAFDSWALFEEVANSDTLSIVIPSSVNAVGTQDVSLMVWDFGVARAFDGGSFEVLGHIEGDLVLHTPNVVKGDVISGTVSWTLSGGGSVGPTDVSVRLSNGSWYNDWTSTDESPLDFSLPTHDLGAGPYNLIVTLHRSGFENLVLWQTVSIAQPVETQISSVSPLTGGVGNESLIPFSLLSESNGSAIVGQAVVLTILDQEMNIIHTDTMLSADGLNYFSWTPTTRGQYNFNLHFERNGVLMTSDFNGSVDVYEKPTLSILMGQNHFAPGSTMLTVFIEDSYSQTISGTSMHTFVTLDGITILDSINTTTEDGLVDYVLNLDKPGNLIVTVFFPAQGWLLGVNNQSQELVLGRTTLLLSLPGQPVSQGTTLGINALVLDWTGAPLKGVPVEIAVSGHNGTEIDSTIVYTGQDGTCSTSHQFVIIGDFWVRATYAGFGLNASASDSVVQRVVVTPTMILTHDHTVNVADSAEFLVGIQDNLGQYITGRLLSFLIEMDGNPIFQMQVTSVNGLVAIFWSPTERGLAVVSLTHDAGTFYRENSTESSISIMEVVNGMIALNTSQIDLFDSVTLSYTLSSTGNVSGADIVFQVLAMDLVPVWTEHVLTDELGSASAIYLADDVHGLLMVTAAPAEDQFMLGGDRQEDLIVMTYAHVMTDLAPEPPRVGQQISVTVTVTDDLGLAINGLRVRIYVYDIYFNLLLSLNRDTVDGFAHVEFTPTQWGAYRVGVSSTGATSVHSFTETGPDTHTVYCPTTILLSIENANIEVGDTLVVAARLTNVYGNPLVGMNVNLSVDGARNLGRISQVTNASGYVSWNIMIDEQGYWTVRAEFFGLATYLPDSDSMVAHSTYGTSVILELQNETDIIAGQVPLNVTVLLVDSGGTPLEGRTIHWEAHHNLQGLVASGNFIQPGVEPVVVEILLAQGGNYTVIFSFAGSDHYHSSNAALEVLVKGTSSIVLEGPTSIDRASDENLKVSVIGELGSTLDITKLNVDITLTNASGWVGIVSWTDKDVIDLSFYGLEVGAYTLNITVADSPSRTGSILIVQIKVTTQSELELVTTNLSGIVNQKHSIILRLSDSLNNTMTDMTVWISLYRPDGTEIYGTLGDTTPVTLTDGLVTISWTPSWTGNYTLVVQYIGDEWRFPSTLERIVLTRRLTTITTDLLEPVDYGVPIEIEAVLTSSLSILGETEVSITVLLGDDIVLEQAAITSSRGIASTTLEGLLAGEYIITIHYAGTDTLAPCSVNLDLQVKPLMSISLSSQTEPYVRSNCTLEVSGTVLGVTPDWTGTLVLALYDPHDTLLLNQTVGIGVHLELMLYIVLELEGQYTIDVMVLGLPVIGIAERELRFTSTQTSIKIPLDAGTTPVVAGAPILGLIGYVLRKRLHGTIDGLPTEWNG